MNNDKTNSYNEWLVLSSQQGDHDAFEELSHYWQQRLFLYVMNRLRNEEAAKETVQECMISISRGIRSVRDPVAFPKWCFQIAERRCADWLRKTIREREKMQTLSEHYEVIQGTEHSETEKLENKLTVQQALAQIDGKLALILRLHYLESFSVMEIAEITQVPIGTVKSRLYYARKTLALILED